MTRLLKLAGIAVLLFSVAVAALLAVTFMGRRPVVEHAVNGIRIIEDGFTSLAVVPITDRQVALVDAGEDQSGEPIKRELARRQLDTAAVAAILMTHGHPDHTGALNQFPQAQIVALEAEVPLIDGRAGAKGPLPRFFPTAQTGVTVDRVLRDGDVVMLGSLPVRVYAVPGHTPDSAYLVNGALLVGDPADVTSEGELQGSHGSSATARRRTVRRSYDWTSISFARGRT